MCVVHVHAWRGRGNTLIQYVMHYMCIAACNNCVSQVEITRATHTIHALACLHYSTCIGPFHVQTVCVYMGYCETLPQAIIHYMQMSLSIHLTVESLRSVSLDKPIHEQSIQ